MSTAQALLEKIQAGEVAEAGGGHSRPGENRCSKVGWLNDCRRHLVLAQSAPDLATPDPSKESIFREGRRQEREMRAALLAAGVQFVEKKPPFWMPDLKLRGDEDDVILGDARDVFVVDYKSMSEAMFNSINSAEVADDMKRSKFPWVRHYPWQMQPYMVARGIKRGMFIIKSKEAGRWKILEAAYSPADFAFIKDGLAEVNAMAEREETPPVLEGDEAAICRWCDFSEFCHGAAGPNTAKPVADGELYAMILRYQEIKESQAKKLVAEMEDLGERIRETSAALGPEILVGEFLVRAERTTYTTYDIPKDIKAKYAKPGEKWKPLKIDVYGGL